MKNTAKCYRKECKFMTANNTCDRDKTCGGSRMKAKPKKIGGNK